MPGGAPVVYEVTTVLGKRRSPPVRSGSVLVVRDVTGLRAEAVPEGVRLSWRLDAVRDDVVIERTIGAMDSFVSNELAALSNATELETEEILRERERLLEEAGDAARAHLDETRTRAESIVAEARREARVDAPRRERPRPAA